MPDELCVYVITASGPDGQPAITLVPLWNGDKLQGERAMDHLQAFGKPQLAQFGPMTYTEMLAPFDAAMGPGPLGEPRPICATRRLRELPDAA